MPLLDEYRAGLTINPQVYVKQLRTNRKDRLVSTQHGLSLGPQQLFTSDLDEELGNTIVTFADGTKMIGNKRGETSGRSQQARATQLISTGKNAVFQQGMKNERHHYGTGEIILGN